MSFSESEFELDERPFAERVFKAIKEKENSPNASNLVNSRLVHPSGGKTGLSDTLTKPDVKLKTSSYHQMSSSSSDEDDIPLVVLSQRYQTQSPGDRPPDDPILIDSDCSDDVLLDPNGEEPPVDNDVPVLQASQPSKNSFVDTDSDSISSKEEPAAVRAESREIILTPPPPSDSDGETPTGSVSQKPDVFEVCRGERSKSPKRSFLSDSESDTNDEKVVNKKPREIKITPPPSDDDYDVPSVSAVKKTSSVEDDDDVGSMEQLLRKYEKIEPKKRKPAKQRQAGSAQEKEADKLGRKLERERLKQHKELEKKQNKEMREAQKLAKNQYDKRYVNKYFTVVIDTRAASIPPGVQIMSMLSYPPDDKPEHMFKYEVTPLAVEGAILWQRRVINPHLEDGVVTVKEEVNLEDRFLWLISAETLVQKVKSNQLSCWVRQGQTLMGGKRPTLIVYGYKEYIRLGINATERVRAANIRGLQPKQKDVELKNNCMSKTQLDRALIKLNIAGLGDHLTFDAGSDRSWKKLAKSVFHYTRAMAEAPDKQRQNEANTGGLEFYAKAFSKDCVNPKNLPEFWKQMVMQVSAGCGLDKAAAITRMYPSPQSLLSAYDRCSSEEAARLLLADMQVRRTDDILGGTRRIGPDISKKLFKFLTCDSGQSFLADPK